MTPIHLATLAFIGERRIDRATGRAIGVELRQISEPMRQRIIDLGMAEPPLVDVEGDLVFLTPYGFAELARTRKVEPQRDLLTWTSARAGYEAKEVDLADVFGYGPSAPGWLEPRG